MTGTIRSVDARGFGVIQAKDGSKVPFVLADVFSHRNPLIVGQRIRFSLRRVQGKMFAEYISPFNPPAKLPRRVVEPRLMDIRSATKRVLPLP